MIFQTALFPIQYACQLLCPPKLALACWVGSAGGSNCKIAYFVSAAVTAFEIFLDFVHEYGVDRLFHSIENIKYAVKL